MNLLEIRAIVAEVKFRNYKFEAVEIGFGATPVLQARFTAKCITRGEPVEQFTRRWLLSPHMTKSEVVATCLKCALTSEEHEAREDFTFQGERIFGPHFDVDALFELIKAHRAVEGHQQPPQPLAHHPV